MITVREGSLQEVEQIVATITEFVRKETVDTLYARLDGKRSLVLVAEEDGYLLGFKIGYQLDNETFYSWFGGVSPQARKRGVAQILMDWQERWVGEQGYHQLKVKSRNQFPSMLRLLLRNGYQIEDFERVDPLVESRIHFCKRIQSEPAQAN